MLPPFGSRCLLADQLQGDHTFAPSPPALFLGLQCRLELAPPSLSPFCCCLLADQLQGDHIVVPSPPSLFPGLQCRLELAPPSLSPFSYRPFLHSSGLACRPLVSQ